MDSFCRHRDLFVQGAGQLRTEHSDELHRTAHRHEPAQPTLRADPEAVPVVFRRASHGAAHVADHQRCAVRSNRVVGGHHGAGQGHLHADFACRRHFLHGLEARADRHGRFPADDLPDFPLRQKNEKGDHLLADRHGNAELALAGDHFRNTHRQSLLHGKI